MDTREEHDAVDVHAHLTPSALLGGGEGLESFSPVVERDGLGRQVRVEIGGRTMSSIVRELERIEVVLEESAAIGVGAVVVSPWVATLPRAMDPGAARELCEVQNGALAGIVAEGRGRVGAFGAVPIEHPAVAAQVLAEAVASGLAGAELTPSAAGRWLGDDALEPFWEAAASLGATIFVHPSTLGLGLDVFGEYYLWNAVANPVETAVAGAHLVMSGALERHRDLRIILAHGGGVLPVLAGRLERAFSVRSEARSRLAAPPSDSLRRFYYDTVTHDEGVLAALVGFAGAGQVMLGSDRPFDMGSDDPVGDVVSLGLSPHDEHLVLAGNARALFASAGLGGR